MIKVGSLFDGIGGWLIAAQRCGAVPVWASEIDDFPMSVTKKHFPKVKHLGDVREIRGGEVEPVDILTMGSPCQDLSIAGKRQGLAGERSGLFMEGIRIANEMRSKTNGEYPKYVIWENVTGAFSSHKRMDFKAVLEAFTETEIPIPESGKWAESGMVRSGKCDIKWRVLDAQYWGVPQRRKRIFLVANLSGNDGTEILFEPQSLSGNLEENRKPEEENPGTSSGSPQGPGQDNRTLLMDIAHHDAAARIQDGTAPTLTGHMGTGGLNVPILYQKLTGTLLARDYKGLNTFDIEENKCFVEKWQDALTIRKLTPLECERLQGLPDNWTNIEFKGKPASDAKRYKAIGNGMAQPCADFVMQRVVAAIRNSKEKKDD